jgi:hypothetical protein
VFEVVADAQADLRRRWALACRHANLATRNDRVPRITRMMTSCATPGCHVIDMPSLARMKKPAGRAIRKSGWPDSNRRPLDPQGSVVLS